MIMKPELLEFKKTSEAGDSTKQTPNDPQYYHGESNHSKFEKQGTINLNLENLTF